MEKRIIELEKKSAFQDMEIEELHDIVVAQQKQIDVLKKQLALMRDNLMSGDLVKKIEDEEAPPHY